MGSRHDLTDEQWAVIEPPISKHCPGSGRPRAEDRRTLNSILDILKTGYAWQDMRAEYGSSITCWRRLSQWPEGGNWELIWRAILSKLDAQGKLEWAQAFLDRSFVPAKRGLRNRQDQSWQREQGDVGGRGSLFALSIALGQRSTA
jgi:transposase